MSQQSKSFMERLTKFFRRFFAKPFRELSRTGKIIQTLWDAAQLQRQQRAHYQRIGEIALGLLKEGRISHMGIERTQAKIEQIERILTRQEFLLRSYQERTDLREVLKRDRETPKDQLEPV